MVSPNGGLLGYPSNVFPILGHLELIPALQFDLLELGKLAPVSVPQKICRPLIEKDRELPHTVIKILILG